MNELNELICAQFDELQLLDFLGIDMEGLVERLQDDIEEHRVQLERMLNVFR